MDKKQRKKCLLFKKNISNDCGLNTPFSELKNWLDVNPDTHKKFIALYLKSSSEDYIEEDIEEDIEKDKNAIVKLSEKLNYPETHRMISENKKQNLNQNNKNKTNI